jgi:hypothetical protein
MTYLKAKVIPKNMISKTTTVVLFLVILVAIVASSSIGYIIGTSGSRSFQSAIIGLGETTTITKTITQNSASNSSSEPGSVPVSPNPYEFSVNFYQSSSTWFIPLVYLGQGTVAQMYVNYDCTITCTGNNQSISSFFLTSVLPESFSIGSNGKLSNTSMITFKSASIIFLQNYSETVLYTLQITPGASGFYTFSEPFGCLPNPVLFVKTGTVSYEPLIEWLRSLKASEIGCSDELQVTILGFTNSYYTEIPLRVSSSS